MASNKALIIVDVQKDFCEGGVLSAKNTKTLIQSLNDLISHTIIHDIPCFFTRDWHPKDHCSFISQGGIWPDHCIQDSPGAEFAEGLIIPDSELVMDVKKDKYKNEMSYSAFGNTNLAGNLNEMKIREVGVTGIATEYCVMETVLDALKKKFKVFIIEDLIRSVDIHPDDSKKAIDKMISAGAKLIISRDWENLISTSK